MNWNVPASIWISFAVAEMDMCLTIHQILVTKNLTHYILTYAAYSARGIEFEMDQVFLISVLYAKTYPLLANNRIFRESIKMKPRVYSIATTLADHLTFHFYLFCRRKENNAPQICLCSNSTGRLLATRPIYPLVIFSNRAHRDDFQIDQSQAFFFWQPFEAWLELEKHCFLSADHQTNAANFQVSWFYAKFDSEHENYLNTTIFFMFKILTLTWNTC